MVGGGWGGAPLPPHPHPRSRRLLPSHPRRACLCARLQIAARYDLIVNPIPYEFSVSAGGAIDAKVTNGSQVAAGTVWAISSPTYDQQPVFEFTAEWDSQPHRGQPLRYDFPWVRIQAD